MAISSLSGVLSPAQIAIVQQARALVARPAVPQATASLPQEQAPERGQRAAQPTPPRGRRGSIINITV
jgi:hypothetical protein